MSAVLLALAICLLPFALTTHNGATFAGIALIAAAITHAIHTAQRSRK